MNRLFLSVALLIGTSLLAMQHNGECNEDGDTLLICAVRQSNSDAVKSLLSIHNKDFYKSRQYVETPNKKGETPLHIAAWIGNQEICTLLLEHGAIPSTRSTQFLTAYDYARVREHKQIIELFKKLKNCQNDFEDLRKKLRATNNEISAAGSVFP